MNRRRQLRFYILKFLRLKDMPQRVALGFAVGACVNFYPTFGAGLLLAGIAATLVGGNITASLIGDILFKPLFPLMFYFDLCMGDLLMSTSTRHLWHRVEHWQQLKALALGIGKIFMVGALINSLILGLILFVVVYKLFRDNRSAMLEYFRRQSYI